MVALPLKELIPLVGPNNAGKSNILSAISWFLAPSVLSKSDFWDQSAPVSVEGTVTGLAQDVLERVAPKHRARISPHVKKHSLCLRRTQPHPDARKSEIALEIFDSEAADNNAGAWVPNVAGTANALQALFRSPIFVGAMENAADDATKAKNTSTLGKLLAEFNRIIHAVWIWPGGDIEHHLGLTGGKKDISTWAPFRKRLENEPYRDVIADSATIESFVHWLVPMPAPAP